MPGHTKSEVKVGHEKDKDTLTFLWAEDAALTGPHGNGDCTWMPSEVSRTAGE
jgi:hypothetical protein